MKRIDEISRKIPAWALILVMIFGFVMIAIGILMMRAEATEIQFKERAPVIVNGFITASG